MMRLEIDTPRDGGPVNSECGVGLLEADREDNCAGRGRILAPIIVLDWSTAHPGEVPKLCISLGYAATKLGKDKNGSSDKKRNTKCRECVGQTQHTFDL